GRRGALRPRAAEWQRRRAEAGLIAWAAGRGGRRRPSRLAACSRAGGGGPSAQAEEPADPPDRRRRDRERGGNAREERGEPRWVGADRSLPPVVRQREA